MNRKETVNIIFQTFNYNRLITTAVSSFLNVWALRLNNINLLFNVRYATLFAVIWTTYLFLSKLSMNCILIVYYFLWTIQNNKKCSSACLSPHIILSRFSLGVHHALRSYANVLNNTETVLRVSVILTFDNETDTSKTSLANYCCSVVTSGEL